ncbi:hypothetical protein V1264_001789 [Littorina saxatilis]|uniref:Uncharacterized protein n=1 Tax=Littorina saxatilis TaxID=31220 RepID=A0AAN9C3K1_9CAEN
MFKKDEGQETADVEDESIKRSIQLDNNKTNEKEKVLNREREREKMDTLLQTELQRIREAMSSLSMDDQDSVFLAASRCLSQLIVFIP